MLLLIHIGLSLNVFYVIWRVRLLMVCILPIAHLSLFMVLLTLIELVVLMIVSQLVLIFCILAIHLPLESRGNNERLLALVFKLSRKLSLMELLKSYGFVIYCQICGLLILVCLPCGVIIWGLLTYLWITYFMLLLKIWRMIITLSMIE